MVESVGTGTAHLAHQDVGDGGVALPDGQRLLDFSDQRDALGSPVEGDCRRGEGAKYVDDQRRALGFPGVAGETSNPDFHTSILADQ